MRCALVMAVAVALAAPAVAAARACPTVTELEPQLVCPSCKTTLDLSTAPIARRMRAYIRRRTEACASADEIKAELVAQFGPRVLASPPKRGFDVLAWLVPLAGGAAALALVGVAARSWTRRRGVAATATDPSLNGRGPLDPALERRLDEELARFE